MVIIQNNVKAPKGEKIWVSYADKEGVVRYITTSKENDRTYYYLYKVDGDKLTKIDKNKNPSEFEELIKY